MNLKQWIKMALVGGGIVMLTACSSMHKNRDDVAINDANSSFDNGGAQTAALGDDSNVGDDQNSKMMARGSDGRVYYFDFDSDAVHDQDKPAIASNAHYLNSHPRSKTLVEGHTDPRGSREYNIGLGERRAKSVASIMTDKGTSPTQIRVVSYGAEKLASNGHSEADYQRDRRVALVYMQR